MSSLMHSHLGAGRLGERSLPRCSPRKCACRSYNPLLRAQHRAQTCDSTTRPGSNDFNASESGPWSTWAHPSEFDGKSGGVSRRLAALHILGAGVAVGLGGYLPERATAAIVDEEVATEVFFTASRSVVSLSVTRTVSGTPVTEPLGTGVVWDGLGHVLTNYHCISRVDKGQELRATWSAAPPPATSASPAKPALYTATASIAGTDTLHDLAVLQLQLQPEAEPELAAAAQQPVPVGGRPAAQQQQGGSGGAGGGGLAPALPAVRLPPPVVLGSSADLKVGQSVYAVGYPYGYGRPTRTLSAGLVSGLDRAIPSPVGARIYGVIQTDAVVNGGNSGGPLLDSFGRMVGLCTALPGRSTGRGSGINFALPADMLRELVPNMALYGNAYGKK